MRFVAMPFELKAGISSDVVRQVEYWFSHVIRLPQIASMPQKGARQQTRSQRLSPIAIVGVNDDHHHRMLENALASAVLAVLVISGIWIVSILAAVP